MSDNKENRGLQDRIRVDANDANEVEFLHSQFPRLSHEQIKQAVEKAGPFRDDIVQELKRIWN
ncbi:hypothetical protein HNQ91_002614 [Filimonas zeae]|uniref:DUF3606 domain-containing protein n=1 Tax=Filimonas zeae TaxID=1737353 RepID=A0A917MTN3_9BACT|nr:DUF3606 domain-containing protein [Filimonas zeae]MDR6339563.1 hypothetical protein [Filimonas zeae]GGH63034.1 hypothetical protein GCM10011379_13480 [Filimonas zeae]